MPDGIKPKQSAEGIPRRLFYYNAGFLRQKRLRRMLELAGHELCIGRPKAQDAVVVWGHSPYAHRGEVVAARNTLPLIRVEDAFLRSIKPGRMGDPPIGLMIDATAMHYNSKAVSGLERILASHPLDDAQLLARARDGITRLRKLDMSKYNLHRSDAPLPPAGYVLVIDQTFGDASIQHSGANAARFHEMLTAAKLEHPNARIIIKTHPETARGLRKGHFTAADTDSRSTLLADAVSPWALLEGATAVYTVSSQLGFEAILAGHRPRVFGQPFYIGWGLTDDVFPLPRRNRSLTRTQLFAAAMILAPIWYDPCRDRLCSFEEAVDQLEAELRSFREDRDGHVATAMRLWKRGRLQAVFGQSKPLIFIDKFPKAVNRARKTRRSLLVWANQAPHTAPADLNLLRVEDGFLRSRGLGADLVAPLSLVTDDLGIYYDPRQESRLERLILGQVPAGGLLRAEKLLHSLIAARLTKYNLAAEITPLPKGVKVLVPGQVEDDASIRAGTDKIATNLALLQAARAAFPHAQIIYKPHPDVEAGLRQGAIAPEILNDLSVYVAANADPIYLIENCDAVVTMTSLLGFEALLRSKPVTCFGAPFYAGWGLTTDHGPVPERRLRAPDGHPLPRPSLLALVHAALIAYPRYYDPQSRRPCPPEVVIERLATGTDAPRGLGLRLLAKLQGRFATHARLWR